MFELSDNESRQDRSSTRTYLCSERGVGPYQWWKWQDAVKFNITLARNARKVSQAAHHRVQRCAMRMEKKTPILNLIILLVHSRFCWLPNILTPRLPPKKHRYARRAKILKQLCNPKKKKKKNRCCREYRFLTSYGPRKRPHGLDPTRRSTRVLYIGSDDNAGNFIETVDSPPRPSHQHSIRHSLPAGRKWPK